MLSNPKYKLRYKVYAESSLLHFLKYCTDLPLAITQLQIIVAYIAVLKKLATYGLYWISRSDKPFKQRREAGGYRKISTLGFELGTFSW